MFYRAGIDIGGTAVKAAIVGENGDLLATAAWQIRETRSPEMCVQRAAQELQRAASFKGCDWPPRAVGIGVPGVIDQPAGVVRFAGALGWKEVPLRSLAEEAFGCRVSIDIDVNAGALADVHFGAAKSLREVVYLSWGTGIGAALVIGGKPYRSSGGAMGNLGHAPADPDSARVCYCGATGCLEVEAGGRAIVERYGSDDHPTPESVAKAALNGDAKASSILNRAAVLMARALAGASAFLNPRMIVLAGGVSGCYAQIEPVFQAEFRRRAPRFTLENLEIRRSRFRAEAGAIGASVLPEVDRG